MFQRTGSRRRRGVQLGLIVIAFVGLSSASFVEGASIEIEITGLNARYTYDTENDVGKIFDAGGENRVGDSGGWSNTDRISSVDFTRNGVEDVGSLQSSDSGGDEFFIDLLIKDVPKIPHPGKREATVDISGGEIGLDLLKKTASGTETLLSLTLNAMTVTYDPTYEAFLITQASALGVAAIDEQNLPFSLELDGTQTISLALGGWVTSRNITDIDGTDYVTAFDVDGTVWITDTQVPEPTAALLALLAVGCGLLGVGRRPSQRA